MGRAYNAGMMVSLPKMSGTETSALMRQLNTVRRSGQHSTCCVVIVHNYIVL